MEIDLRLPDENECFLCGKKLTDDRSDEHVYPQWFLRSHNLWNGEVDLLNGTRIKVNQVLIPCCAACNNGPLSRLEDAVKKAFDGGISAVREFPRDSLFQWCCKI